MPIPKTNLKLSSKLIVLVWLGLSLLISSCKPTDFETIRRADQEALAQRAQLAKYLYVQVIKERSSRDDVRLRALEGLAEVTSTQTFEYDDAVKAIAIAIQEFGRDPQYDFRILNLRQRGAEIYRNNLQNYTKALEMIEPALKRKDVSVDVLQLAARIHLSLRMFEEAERELTRAWDLANQVKRCELLRSIQLDMIQRYVLERKCDMAMKWMDQPLVTGCEPDHFYVETERANCLEMSNESAKAMKIYEDLIAKDPGNSRAHFLLDGLKRRIKEKSIN